MIPLIAKEFGVDDAPSKWPGSSFDRTWVITFETGKKPQLKDLPPETHVRRL